MKIILYFKNENIFKMKIIKLYFKNENYYIHIFFK